MEKHHDASWQNITNITQGHLSNINTVEFLLFGDILLSVT